MTDKRDRKPKYADPTPEEIWGVGGLAEQMRELRERDRKGPSDRGQGRIRVCKTNGKLREVIE